MHVISIKFPNKFEWCSVYKCIVFLTVANAIRNARPKFHFPGVNVKIL